MIRALRTITNCPTHGLSPTVLIADALQLCQPCFEQAVEQYKHSYVCLRCSGPVFSGTGFLRGPELVRMCISCQADELRDLMLKR